MSVKLYAPLGIGDDAGDIRLDLRGIPALRDEVLDELVREVDRCARGHTEAE